MHREWQTDPSVLERVARDYLSKRSVWARIWWVLRRAVLAAHEDGCFGIAKAVAYSGLLTIFPLFTTLTAILVQANAIAVADQILRFLFQVVPPGTHEIVASSFTVRGQRPGWLLVFATLVALWAASGAMTSLMEGFRAAYHIPKGRPFVRERLVAIALVFFGALPVIGASAMILFAGRVQGTLMRWLGFIEGGEQLKGWLALLGTIINFTIAILTTCGVTAGLYHYGPNRARSWRRVWPGAIVATFFWMAATVVFSWYVRNIANYNLLYGSIGAVIALLVWMYVLAAVALGGCEVNAELDRVRDSIRRAPHRD